MHACSGERIVRVKLMSVPGEERNGGIPFSGDPRVDAASNRIRGKFRDLEDAMLVQAHLEKRAGERIKEHAEWLVRHEEAIGTHDERMAELDIKMAEMTEKVNFLIDRDMRREGGPENAR